MTATTNHLDSLIARSIQQDGIVRTRWTAAAEVYLRSLGEDSVEANDEQEHWGSDDQPDMGGNWRVHLTDVEEQQAAAIRKLAGEAAEAGDEAQVEQCNNALAGDNKAWRRCVDVLIAAAAAAEAE